MSEFRATTDDLREIIRRQQVALLKRQASYPAGAFVASAVLLPLYAPAGFIALGIGFAWSLSLYWQFRGLSRAYTWRYAWLMEGVVVDVLEDGLRLSSQRGTSLYRWDGGAVVRSLGASFVLEDQGEDFIVLPKRYLNSQELMTMQSRVRA
jgi:hypothetical protein